MFFGKSEFRGKMFTHQIAIQKGDWTSASVQKLSEQHIGNGRFAGAGESREKNSHTLFVARRIAPTQLLHNLGGSKRGGNITAFVEPLSQFCPGKGQKVGAV